MQIRLLRNSCKTHKHSLLHRFICIYYFKKVSVRAGEPHRFDFGELSLQAGIGCDCGQLCGFGK